MAKKDSKPTKSETTKKINPKKGTPFKGGSHKKDGSLGQKRGAGSGNRPTKRGRDNNK